MPELYQRQDRRSLATARTVVVGVIVVGLATVLGAVVGGKVVAGHHPTKADVREAAHSLLPPGYTVTTEKLNAYEGTGIGFAPPAYAVDLEVEGGGTSEERLSDFNRQAASAGWLAGEEPGVASFLRFERPGGVLASVTVGGEGGSSQVGSFRLKEPPLGPVFTFAGLGALVGLVIALVGGFLILRPRRPPRPWRPPGT